MTAEPPLVDEKPATGLARLASTSRLAAGWALTPALRAVVPAFLVTKVLTLLVVLLTVYERSRSVGFPHFQELLAPFGGWDAQWYLAIAADGYPAGPLDLVPGHPGHLWAYFPGYPLLVRAASSILPNPVVAGILVSSICEVVAMVYLYKLVVAERDNRSARFSVWLLVLFPYAVFLSAVYTEAPFLAAATAALYHMRRGDLELACVATALAISVRISGLALLPALVTEWLLNRRDRRLAAVFDLGIAMLPLPLMVIFAQATTGDALAFLHAETSASFSHHLTWPWAAFWSDFQLATGRSPASFDAGFMIQLVLAALGGVAVAMAWWRRLPPSFCVYATATWLLHVSLSFWLSVGRYEMALIPVLALLAADLSRGRPEMRTALLVGSGLLMGHLTTLFATGVFVA